MKIPKKRYFRYLEKGALCVIFMNSDWSNSSFSVISFVEIVFVSVSNLQSCFTMKLDNFFDFWRKEKNHKFVCKLYMILFQETFHRLHRMTYLTNMIFTWKIFIENESKIKFYNKTYKTWIIFANFNAKYCFILSDKSLVSMLSWIFDKC